MNLQLKLTSLLFFTSAIAETFDSNPKFPCQPPHHSSYPFCNISLSTTKRALSLVSLLTLPEKITQLSNTAASVPRLGIPPYEWWSESLHGLADNGPGVSFNGSISSATSFPQVIVSAASFNRTLWREIGSAVAVEGRAMYNGGQAGLTYWAPNINVFRDPRWGRGQETPGEDPKVVSEYGVEFVRGFQEIKKTNVLKSSLGNGDDDDDGDGDGGKLMLSACCKHFTAYDLEKWGNFTRYDFNAVVTEQDMEDTYQPPFQSCIEDGKASCLMCSYNAVNGVPACARQDLLQKARVDWGFKGYITSDCDAVATIFDYQGYTNSAEEAVADAIKAGVDINCGTYMVRHTQSAIDKGKVSEEQIDRALQNLFAVQLRLGLFDGNPKQGRYAKLGTNDICSSSHRELALEAARQGIVLLKNDHKLLPLKKSHVSSLAIIGPMANNISSMGGTYTGKPCQRKTLFSELLEYVKKTSYASGCSDVACDSPAGFKEAVAIAKGADFVVVVAGLDLTQETEDKDRVSLSLPGKQRDLVTSIAAASKKPVILVLTGGGPVDETFAKTDPRIGSIVWIGYPGETGGQALAEILFGDFNPGGRLPMTWYPQSFSEVAMSDMHMRADSSRGYPGRTYRFYTGDQVYKFGTGLSYTEFDYEILSAPTRLGLSEVIPQDSSSHKKLLLQKGEGELRYLQLDDLAVNSCESLRFNVRFSVRNTGEIDGSHVLMLYSRMPRVLSGVPERQLIGFERVHVRSSEMVEAEFVIDPCKHLSVANDVGKRVIPLGVHDLVLGDLKHSLSLEF
ncbi:PREDICTED: probable beta-D-xylosidase 6 [Brassica oleracea var. oleracea]|uniref:Fibronectin type III-like domain-containing protein n=1 Tax=Brassica oleracea var. oleracea TaxID=109376 RepID=A0A0D3EGE9_BRAOL|nr:PREDICTED: probable beta-D-xylosidase 6 [Brassica oleracea var. oleracea]